MKYFKQVQKNGNFIWKDCGLSLADKLQCQKKARDAHEALDQVKLKWYAFEKPCDVYNQEYAKYFKIHKRRGYELHELLNT